MKKHLLILLVFILTAGYSGAQVVSDFEFIPMNVMLGGANDSSSMTVVPNPDTAGNNSWFVTKYVRDMDGVPWGGFWSPTPVDLSVNKYVHVKVWKSRISPVKFKIESPGGNIEVASKYPQTLVGQWEDMVFDFSAAIANYGTIVFMPDFEDPLTLTSDITIYFDDIIINNDSTPNSAPVTVVENYEIMALNPMFGGAADSSYMTLIPNPDPSGINPSKYVIKFLRDKDGIPWGGFWSPTPIDVTTNKYMHVKVWKPRISPIKFKIEGGTAGNLEIASMSPQANIGQWEDMVFDFSTKTGPYPTIVFMPDFEDPLTLTEDIVIYFDDIILNNDPNPIALENVDLNVNMAYWRDLGDFDPANDFVDVAGDFNGWDGANHHLTTTNDSVYSITLPNLLPGTTLNFKFRINGSWNDATCEFPFGGPARTYTVVAGSNVYNGWYDNDSLSDVTFEVNMSNYALMGIFNPASDFVDIAGSFNGWDGVNHHLTTVDDSIYTINVDSLKYGQPIEFKFRINGSWSDATCEFPSGGPNRWYMIPAGPSTYSAWYNNQAMGISNPSFTGELNVFPNPMGDQLNIQSSVNLSKVVVSTSIGQQVAVFENLSNGMSSFDISNLNDGVYFITFFDKSGAQMTQKLIKQ
jgi:hypothetical protein